jgi:alkylation response protein AidB-like acyl-CoA dehydrogenase
VQFNLTPDLEALGAEAREVGARAAAKVEMPEDSWLIGNDREFSAEMAERGWLGMTWPTEHGGAGKTALERFVVVEALIATGAPIASSWFADRQIGPTMLQFGTDEQRQQYLPGIINGTDQWSIGMSEPDAGSDVASVRTRAERDGDRWIVNGQKIWTSGAADADYIYLIARTDPDAPAHKGLSEFVVAMDSPGITIKPITDLTGNEHFCEVFFEDVEVPYENLVGEPNESFRQVMRQMEHERGGIDRLVSNRSLYDLIRNDVRDRGEHISDPLLRQEFAKAETIYTIARHMILREVMGQAPAGWSAITKTLATEFETDVANLCGRMIGAESMLWNRVTRNICYAPAYTLMGGTTLILRNIIGERVLGLPREPRPS